MTPTRLALLSLAVGSRQCKASTGLGRGPHVSSFLHMHLPISPLPSSFLALSLPSFFYLSPSFLPSFLTIHLPHPFLLFFLSLKICSFHIPSTNLYWRSKTNSSPPQEAAHGKLYSINTGVAEELHALLQSALPSLTSLALCSQHTPQAHKEGNAGQSPPVLVMTLMLDRGRWEPWGSSVQGKHGIARLHKGKLRFLKTDFLEVWCILRSFL